MLDIVDAGRDASLEADRDPAGHLFGRQALVVEDYGQDGNVDVGEDVHRHRYGFDPAEKYDQ